MVEAMSRSRPGLGVALDVATKLQRPCPNSVTQLTICVFRQWMEKRAMLGLILAWTTVTAQACAASSLITQTGLSGRGTGSTPCPELQG